MTYASLAGLETYMGQEAFAAWQSAQPDAERALERTEARLLAAILPNSPRGGQAAAFERAVYAQIAWEAEPANRSLNQLPGGVTGFSIGDFSATLSGDIAPGGLCRDARTELLNSGLFYRGVPC